MDQPVCLEKASHICQKSTFGAVSTLKIKSILKLQGASNEKYGKIAYIINDIERKRESI